MPKPHRGYRHPEETVADFKMRLPRRRREGLGGWVSLPVMNPKGAMAF